MMRGLREKLAVAGLARLGGVVLLWALLLGGAVNAWAQQASAARGLSFAPVPAWVQPQAVPLDAAAPAEGLNKGQHYLLADEQVRIVSGTLVSYHHIASRAVNERGVEEIASVQLRFDPSYQTLVIHRIDVKRAGRTVSTVAPGAVKLLQRESSLESLIFDGRLTAHVALHDVRVGDVVEYVYSLQGDNPVFGGRHFGSFDLDWDTPVARRTVRVLWPKGRPLYWKLHNQAAAAQVSDLGAEVEHRWDLRNVPPKVLDSDSPGWYDPYNWVEWSEFENWAAVTHWAQPLYRLPAGPMPAVDREVARIAAETSDPEQRLLSALRFVQREVRYLGIEMGVNSHAPHAPEVVLQRRFGDCKDKTLLSIALLRGLGIAARPALVHTGLRQAAADRLPTPGAFNHVLVQADVGGRRVWLDPTRSPQAGRGVAQWVQADFGRALLVDADSREMVAMAGPQARLHTRQVRTLLDASAGFDQPASFTVTTTASGAAAEQLRATLADNARDSLQKQYLDYYAASYPGLTVEQPFSVRDDVDANTLEIVERYRMPSYWTRDEKQARWKGELEVPDLLEWLRRPSGLNRQGPLGLRHPVDFTLVSEFRLPGNWGLKPEKLHVEDPAFELRREEAWQGATLVLTDHYLSREDHVAAADMARYVGQLDKARTGVGFSLTHTGGSEAAGPASAGAGTPHWLPLIAGLLALGGLAVLGRRLYRWDPEPPALPLDPAAASGIGGWLLLPPIGLAVTLYRVGKSLLESTGVMDVQSWVELTKAHALWAPTLLFDLVLQLAIGAGALLLLWLMVKRRSNLPRIYVGWWVLVIVMTLGDAIAFQIIPALREQWGAKDSAESVRACVFGAIWISYFLRSERVRRTFVERLGARQESPLAPPIPAVDGTQSASSPVA